MVVACVLACLLLLLSFLMFVVGDCVLFVIVCCLLFVVALLLLFRMCTWVQCCLECA